MLLTCQVRSPNLLSVGGCVNLHRFPNLAISPKNFAPASSGQQADCSGQRMLVGSAVATSDASAAPSIGLSSVLVFDGDVSERNLPLAMMLLGPEDTTFVR